MSLINPDRRALLAALGAAGVAAVAQTPALARAAARKPFFKRIGKPIGLQLYALGDKPTNDMDGTLAKLAAIGLTDIELPGFYNRTPKDLAPLPTVRACVSARST